MPYRGFPEPVMASTPPIVRELVRVLDGNTPALDLLWRLLLDVSPTLAGLVPPPGAQELPPQDDMPPQELPEYAERPVSAPMAPTGRASLRRRR